MVINIFSAKILSLGDYGVYAAILNTFLTISALAQFSTGYTVAKYVAEYRDKNKTAAASILEFFSNLSIGFSIVASILMVVFPEYISNRLFGSSNYVPEVRVGALFVAMTAVNAYQISVLTGLESFKSMASAGISSGVMQLLLAIIGVYCYGLSGLVISQAIASLIRYLIHRNYVKEQIAAIDLINAKVVNDSRLREWGIFFKFSIPAAMAGASALIAIWVANVALINQENGVNEMAIYSVAIMFKTLMLFFPNVMNMVGMSILNNSRHAKAGMNNSVHRVFRENLINILVSLILGGLVVVLLSGLVIELFFMEKYSGAKKVVYWVVISGVLEGLSLAVYQLIHLSGKMWVSFLAINIPRDGLLVALAYLGLYAGATGLAKAIIISSAVGLVATIALYVKIKKEVN